MEVFLPRGEGDKKFIVFPAPEMLADSLSSLLQDLTRQYTAYYTLRVFAYTVCTYPTQ